MTLIVRKHKTAPPLGTCNNRSISKTKRQVAVPRNKVPYSRKITLAAIQLILAFFYIKQKRLQGPAVASVLKHVGYF